MAEYTVKLQTEHALSHSHKLLFQKQQWSASYFGVLTVQENDKAECDGSIENHGICGIF